jgi:UTP--glucose-1-phosphate uridylyltransferase
MPHPIESELAELPPPLIQLLERHGFARDPFVQQVAHLDAAESDNRVDGVVEPPSREDVLDVAGLTAKDRDEARALGEEALRRGEVALVVLAGGMATRMGGVVKALVEALPGHTFLDLRLGEQRVWKARLEKAPPLWLMTSHSTDEAIIRALGSQASGDRLATFHQNLSLRVTPDGHLFRDAHGEPSVHAPGHGDLPDALARSGLLDRFVDGGGQVVMMANLDNLGATLDPLLLGLHLRGDAPVSCEVVRKVGTDRGGIPVRVDGRPVILEEFRLPKDFDPTSVPVFNTNTFYFDAEALRTLTIPWTYFVVKKEVEGKAVVQFERLVNEVTAHLPTRYFEVPRDGVASRFVPVKDHAELEQRRPELTALVKDRGLLQ